MVCKMYFKDEEEFEEDETRKINASGRQNFRKLEEQKKHS